MKHSGLFMLVAGVAFVASLRAPCFAGPQSDASETRPKMDERTGVAVGQKVPAFQMKDQEGEERSLQQLLAKGNVALVFHRSANW